MFSAGSIFNISKYRDTCESFIPIFSGIAIILVSNARCSIPSIRRHRVHSTTSTQRRDIMLMASLFTGANTTALHGLT